MVDQTSSLQHCTRVCCVWPEDVITVVLIEALLPICCRPPLFVLDNSRPKAIATNAALPFRGERRKVNFKREETERQNSSEPLSQKRDKKQIERTIRSRFKHTAKRFLLQGQDEVSLNPRPPIFLYSMNTNVNLLYIIYGGCRVPRCTTGKLS